MHLGHGLDSGNEDLPHRLQEISLPHDDVDPKLDSSIIQTCHLLWVNVGQSSSVSTLM